MVGSVPVHARRTAMMICTVASRAVACKWISFICFFQVHVFWRIRRNIPNETFPNRCHEGECGDLAPHVESGREKVDLAHLQKPMSHSYLDSVLQGCLSLPFLLSFARPSCCTFSMTDVLPDVLPHGRIHPERHLGQAMVTNSHNILTAARVDCETFTLIIPTQ